MKFICKTGIHQFHPTKVFSTRITLAGKTLRYVESYTGYECHCGARKIKKNKYQSQSSGATQEAYDWLNEKPAKAEILKMVKK